MHGELAGENGARFGISPLIIRIQLQLSGNRMAGCVLSYVTVFALQRGIKSICQTKLIVLENKVKALQTDFTGQVAQLQQHQTQTDTANSGLQSDLSVVTKRLRLTQGDLRKARQEAEEIKTESEQKIAEMDGAVKTELATKASTDDVKTVDGRVTGVRTDLDTTQNDLKMARSELGTLIARNHEDVEQLRRLGERDYIEFTIDAKNKPQKVGAFVVELRGTNLNKKRYSVSLIVDDVHIDKKNMPVNEPVFFHQGNDRRPLELVVNQVAKDKVTGYISTPKAGTAQTASSGN